MSEEPTVKWTPSAPQPRPSRVVPGLLVAILAALLALIVVVWMRGGPAGGDGGSAGTGSGSAAGVPEDLLRETYSPDKTYRSLMNFEMTGRGSHKDWGMTTNMNFVYAGELEILRTIESNDGTRIVLVQEFRRAQNVRIATTISDISIVPQGFTGGMMLTFADWVTTAAVQAVFKTNVGHFVPVSLEYLEFLANTPVAKQALSRAATANDTQAMAYVDTLQGRRFRITYVNGEGVESAVPLDGKKLEGRDRDLVYASAIISDAYVWPQGKTPPGTKWTIPAENVIPILDPSLNARAAGALSATRGLDEGSPPNDFAIIDIDDASQIHLESFDGTIQYSGHWNPTGRFMYSLSDHIVNSGTLRGEFEIGARSTGHWWFEMRHTIKPKYVLYYTGQIESK